MSVKQRLSLKAGKRLGLLPHVRDVLSTGIDFFFTLNHLEPIPRNIFGGINRHLWVHIENYFQPCYGDPPSWLPDGRLDFLRGEWEKYKDEVMRFHLDRWRNGTRPWAWWMWDAPEPYPVVVPRGGTAADYYVARRQQASEAHRILLRHNLVTEEEIFLIRAADEAVAAALRPGPGEDAPE